MRKKIFTIASVTLLLVACQTKTQKDSLKPIKHPNKIDKIETVNQIQRLLKSIDKRYADFKVIDPTKSTDKNCKRIFDSLNIAPFTKADFDNNGYTDLLVIGDWGDPSIVCIFDQGENKFLINR